MGIVHIGYPSFVLAIFTCAATIFVVVQVLRFFVDTDVNQNQRIVFAIATGFAVVMGTVFHELGHYAAAKYFDIGVVKVNLAPEYYVRYNTTFVSMLPSVMLLTALAGPLFQMFYALIFRFAVAKSLEKFAFLRYVYAINMLLVITNLLPLDIGKRPLDGFVILWSILRFFASDSEVALTWTRYASHGAYALFFIVCVISAMQSADFNDYTKINE